MDIHEKEFITRHKPQLLESIFCTESLLAGLQKYDILCREDIELIRSCETQTGKAAKLLDILPTRSKQSYQVLTMLLEDQKQSGAVKILKYLKKKNKAKGSFDQHQKNLFVRLPVSFKKTLHHTILLTEDIALSKRRFQEYFGKENIDFYEIEDLERECEMEGIENPVETRDGYYAKILGKLLVIVPVKTKTKLFTNWELIKEHFEWEDFSKSGQQSLLDKQIQFQSHTLSLREMCNVIEGLNPQLDFSFLKCLESSLIIKLLNNDATATKIAEVNFPKVPTHYTNRKLRTRSRISRTVLNVTKTNDPNQGDIFVFSCPTLHIYDLASFVERFGNGSCDTSGSQLELRHPNVSCILLDTEADFDHICSKASHRPVHLLECLLENKNTGPIREIYWRKSTGSIATIQRYIHRVQNEFSESKLYNNDNRVGNTVIISDAPGMGKSSLLAKCASELTKDHHDFVIVQFVILRDFMKKLPHFSAPISLDFEIPSLDSCTNCMVTLGSSYEIGRLFLTSLLNSNKSNIEGLPGKLRIEIMFDGIDELESCNLNKANDIIKRFSKNSNVRAWITSRPHLLESIEHCFDVLGYKISPLDENDQVNFLSNYWHDGNTICHQMYEIARTTLQKLKETLSATDSTTDVAGTPLLCFLLAEIFKENAHECHEQDVSHAIKRRITDLSITNLYEQYIAKSLGKCDVDDITDSAFLQHVEVAIHILFPELQPPFILSEWKTNNAGELLRYGLMQSTGIAEPCQFVHVTFAQYMVARGIIHILKCMSNHRLLANSTLDTTNTQFQKYTILVKKVLSVKMSPLQFSKFGEGSICRHAQFKFPNVCLFFNHSIDFDIDIEIMLDKLEQKYNHDKFYSANNIWVSLTAAISSNHFRIANPLIEALTYIVRTQEEIKQFFCKYPQNKLPELVYLAAKFSSEDLLGLISSLCLSWDKETLQISDYVFDCDLKFSNDQIEFLTPLHVSIEAGNYKATRYLLLNGYVKRVHTDILKYKFLLHFLLKNSTEDSKVTIQRKKEILEILYHSVPDLFVQKIPGPDVILERINLGLLLCYLENKRKVQNMTGFYQTDIATNEYGENMLHLLATGHYDAEISPEKYHRALLQINTLAPYLDIVSYLKAQNHGGWSAADVACSFIDLLDETLDLFRSLGIFCKDAGNQQSATIFKAVAGQRDGSVLGKLIQYNPSWKPKAFGTTILHVAASYLNFSAVNFFINSMNQEVNEKDVEGNTPLHVCFRVELETLIGNETVVPKHGVHKTVVRCQPQLLQEDLVQRPCNNTVTFSYSGEHTPRNNEVQTNIEREPSNQHKIIFLLIEKGALIDIKNNKNITPLNLALEISLGGLDEEEKRVLVSERYNLFSSKDYMTMALKGLLLNYQIGYLWHPSLILSFADQLKRRGGNIHYRDPIDGSSLVHLAARNHSFFGVKYLIENEGLSPNLKNLLGETPVLYMKCAEKCNTFNHVKLRKYLNNLVGIS